MPPKKRKIIKKRKITKADVKKIPKVPIAKPNINISPYDLANMVQQKFRQDMEADNINIQRRQAELQAQKKAIESPEFQRALDANTKSLMSLQQEMQMFKHEQQRQQIESQRAYQQSPEFKEILAKLTKIRQDTKHSRDMTAAELDRIQANVIREIQSSQETYNQHLEKAIVQRETEHIRAMNDLREQQAQLHAESEARARRQDDLIKQTLEKQKTEYMKQMNDLKTQQAQIAADAIVRERTRDQVIERAQVERQIQLTKEMNDRFDKWDSETARLEARKMEQKGELHAKGLKRTKDAAQKAANEQAKVKEQTKNLDELIEVTEQENENIKRKAYYEALRTKGAENAKAVGEAKAQQELERERLEREIDYAKRHQKALLEHEIVAKQSQKIIKDLQEQIKEIKSSDPTSRLTGDPALIEVDLYMLGEEKKRYEQAQRDLAQERVYQHAMLDMQKEVDALAREINDTGQGITFSQLYSRRPDSIIKSMADLAQMRQGRKVFSENVSSIFPAVKTAQMEIERRAEQLASREQTIEAEKTQLSNQLRDTQVMNQKLQQQLAMTTQQLAMATGQQQQPS